MLFRSEQMISLQNQLYEKLNVNKQVCRVNTRGGASTQDPDYPEDHPKRKEQEARKKKLSAGKSPNENQDKDDSEEQDNDISISDAETEDNNNEEGLVKKLTGKLVKNQESFGLSPFCTTTPPPVVNCSTLVL